jgi:hypothetical protein
MGIMINSGSDVISFLKEQHEEIKALLASTAASHGQARSQAFTSLRRMLAVHETAEEEIVHPAARRALPDGEAIVAQRLKEENEAKKMLSELEKLEPESAPFETKLEALRVAVVAHAEAEEREEFNRLATQLDPQRLERMRKAAQLAQSVAPTRPHPGMESATANLFVGPFAAMVDRARDALSGK